MLPLIKFQFSSETQCINVTYVIHYYDGHTSPKTLNRELLPHPFGPHTRTFSPDFTFKTASRLQMLNLVQNNIHHKTNFQLGYWVVIKCPSKFVETVGKHVTQYSIVLPQNSFPATKHLHLESPMELDQI